MKKHKILGAEVETIAIQIHKLKADDPRMVNKYIQLSKKAFKKCQVTERLTAPSLIKREH